MTPFDVRRRPRVVFGAGRLAQLGEYARHFGRRALVVTDRGLVAAGHVESARRVLEAAGVAVAVFDGCTENPTTSDVDACLEIARAFDPEVFVGLGGGSSLDTAKGANLLLTNGGRIHDYWGKNKAPRPVRPMIAVPTTAGTGSEMQSYALISDAETHAKMACGDDKLTPEIALLDPVLTLTQPRETTATCGVDTLVHAAETAVTTTRNEWSLLLSHEAFRLTCEALPRVLADGGDLEARGRMMLAAGYAGLAIEASTLGAAHSCANPLTQHFDVPHGRAVGLMLPAVIDFNVGIGEARDAYGELARRAGVGVDAGDVSAAVVRLVEGAGLPLKLAVYGVTRSDVPALAAGASQQWTARFNPRPVATSDFEAIYFASGVA